MNANNYNNSSEKNQNTEEPDNMMKTQLGMYQRRNKRSVGRWTNTEHETFVQCLKKYGRNWDKFEEMIPTRSSIQIRSHLQKYFGLVKKEYNTDNPMKYIMNNMGGMSKTYKFENFDGSIYHEFNTTDCLQDYNNQGTSNTNLGVVRRSIENSEKNSNKEKAKEPNKRILKMNKKNLEYFDENNDIKDECRRQKVLINEEKQHQKIFKTLKMTKEYSNSSSNDENNEQKNNSTTIFNTLSLPEEGSNNFLPEFRSAKNNSNSTPSFKFPLSTNSKSQSQEEKQGNYSKNYIVLNNGSIVIQGNEVETSVSCNIKKIGEKTSIITPLHSFRIRIEPLNEQSLTKFDTGKQNSSIMNGSNYQKTKRDQNNLNEECEREYRQSEKEIINESMMNYFCLCDQ